MDRPAILKTSRPGVPGRGEGSDGVSIASAPHLQGNAHLTNTCLSNFIVLIHPNAIREIRKCPTFERHVSSLGQKSSQSWDYLPLGKPLHKRIVTRRFAPFLFIRMENRECISYKNSICNTGKW